MFLIPQNKSFMSIGPLSPPCLLFVLVADLTLKETFICYTNFIIIKKSLCPVLKLQNYFPFAAATRL